MLLVSAVCCDHQTLMRLLFGSLIFRKESVLYIFEEKMLTLGRALALVIIFLVQTKINNYKSI